MSLAAKRAEREMELRATLQLRQREIQRLQQRQDELHSVLNVPAGGGNSLGASYPVTAYCGKNPSKKLATVPLEQAENILAQLRVAKAAIRRHNELARHNIHKTESELRHSDKQLQRIEADMDSACLATGMARPSQAKRSVRMSISNQQARGGVKNGGELVPAGESNSVVVTSAQLTNAELAKRNTLLAKEIHAAEVVMHKKNQTLKRMRAMKAQQEESQEVANSIANEVRCIDRDIRTKGEALKELCAEHEVVDNALHQKLDPTSPESTSLVTLERDVDHLATVATTTVVNERRMQERVIKAQDYRIAELEKRLATVEKALANHKLTAEVDRMRIESMRGEGLALQVTDNEEELYDIELIIPAQEKVHPAIYSLFLAEKERLAKQVGVLNLIAKEKEETIDALSCKTEALTGDCNRTLQDLDKKVIETSAEEEKLRSEAMGWVQENRNYYDDLLRERNELRASVKRNQRK